MSGARAADLDTINRNTWKLPGTVRVYEHLEGWTDPGERAALEHVADEARGVPVLDIGVGAGRTIPLLRAMSPDYVGIDYTAEMVTACRARHPDARIEHMDARDLGRFRDGQFGLAVFSFNGIDAVHVDDRQQVLREVQEEFGCLPLGVGGRLRHVQENPDRRHQIRFQRIIQRLAGEAAKAAKHPSVAERFAVDSAEAVGSTPQEYAEFITAEQARWGDVVRKAGVKVN